MGVDLSARRCADLQQLAALVNAAAGTSYKAYLEDGDGQSTGFEQNIGYLVNRARIDVLGTEQVFRGKTFDFGGSTDLLHDRPPFILQARVIHTGMPLTVILNHLRSLIDVNSHLPDGACDGELHGERPVRCSYDNARRHERRAGDRGGSGPGGTDDAVLAGR